MALVPNLTRWKTLGPFSIGDNLTTSIQYIVTRQEIYQDINQRRELICEQEVTTCGSVAGASMRNITGRVLSVWEYDSATKLPLYEKREEWATVWLPKVSEQYGGLVKVEEVWTRYWCHPPYLAQSSHSERSGYVIYDITPTVGDVTAARDRGYRVDTTTNRILDSARDWRSATKAVAVVEAAAQPQQAVWVSPLETVDVEADEDFHRILIWTIRHDRLRAAPPECSGPEVILKTPIEVNLAVTLDPPELRASEAGAAGVCLEIRGGGGSVTRVWPVEMTETVPPERYVVERRILTAPGAPTDPYRMSAIGATVPRGTSTTLAVGAAVDLDGDPTDPLPAATPLAKPDQVADPVEEEWQQIAEGTNAETDAARPGRLVLYDADVAAGGAYAYRAVAIWQQTESQPSTVAEVAISASNPRTQGLAIWTNAKARTIEALSPVDPGYGETRVLEVPAALSAWPDGPGQQTSLGAPEGDAAYGAETAQVPVGEEAWELADAYEQGLTDAVTFGSEVAARQFARYADAPPQVLKLRPIVALPMLERGQNLALGAIAATVTQAGSIYSVTLPAATWRVEGFEFNVSVSGGQATVDFGTIECEARPTT